jgi:hypothetical protein
MPLQLFGFLFEAFSNLITVFDTKKIVQSLLCHQFSHLACLLALALSVKLLRHMMTSTPFFSTSSFGPYDYSLAIGILGCCLLVILNLLDH